jgi:hypothetical protein
MFEDGVQGLGMQAVYLGQEAHHPWGYSPSLWVREGGEEVNTLTLIHLCWFGICPGGITVGVKVIIYWKDKGRQGRGNW